MSSPTEAQAGLLSSILGTEAQANTAIQNPTQNNNSQTMPLLQANISPLNVVKEKSDKTTKKDSETKAKTKEINQNQSVNIVSDNALLAAVKPKSAAEEGVGGGEFSFSEEDIEIYVVRAGDTVNTVATLFGVSADTILSANNMKKGDTLKPGDVLLILPFSGVEHTVAKGETMQSIAKKYKVDVKDILNANDLDTGAKLAIGEKLMVPGANLPNVSGETKPKSASGSKSGGGSSSSVPSVSGYFKNPLPGARRSRGVSAGHRGVDLAAPTGTPIHAAAEGSVLIARNGYNGGFGNYVVVEHDNGTKTLYAHMSKLGTTPGAKVSQGEVIGYVGNTGNSRGAHLHFEVLGGNNPF